MPHAHPEPVSVRITVPHQIRASFAHSDQLLAELRRSIAKLEAQGERLAELAARARALR